MKPLEDFADERARVGEVAGKSCSPWLDPARDFATEAQEESGDRHNYLTWELHQARIAGEASDEYVEAMMIAIQANRTSYVAALRAQQLRSQTREAKQK